ncbi:hypothetical protein V8F33_006481 [Rhypophila sp. PSN 637]
MVKITTVVLSALATLAAARNCTPGLDYCGKTLRAIATGSNYDAQMKAPLRERGIPVNEGSMNDSLFYCVGGSNGDVRVLLHCPKGCLDGGKKRNNFCRLP